MDCLFLFRWTDSPAIMQLEEILQHVGVTFRKLGADEGSEITRTVLLKDRYFVGYRFGCGGLRAVWFADSGVLKFHDAEGKLVRKIQLDGEESFRKAA